MASPMELSPALLEPLERDLRATLGPRVPDDEVARVAAGMREFASTPAEYVERVVESVQQAVHDLFIDTTWPACPRHPQHPLWYHAGAWWCSTDRVAIAPIGELRTTNG